MCGCAVHLWREKFVFCFEKNAQNVNHKRKTLVLQNRWTTHVDGTFAYIKLLCEWIRGSFVCNTAPASFVSPSMRRSYHYYDYYTWKLRAYCKIWVKKKREKCTTERSYIYMQRKKIMHKIRDKNFTLFNQTIIIQFLYASVW